MIEYAHDMAEPPVPAARRPAELIVHADRRDLLDQISNFLLAHDLAVSPANLALAQAIFSGENATLHHQISARQRANEPIAQEWLDEFSDTVRAGTCDPDRAIPQDNRQELEQLLNQATKVARAAGEPLSIAFCDIDRCSDINGAHGRDTGDRVIQAVARALQRLPGQGDAVMHGGGEFVLLCRGLTPAAARQLLDDAREAFAHRKLIDRKTRKAIGSVTFSGGVADALAFSDPQAVLTAAAKALRLAKDQGGNRIVVAQERADL